MRRGRRRRRAPPFRFPGSAAIDDAPERHWIVVVGDGARGLELATRLGDQLGRRGRPEETLVDRAR